MGRKRHTAEQIIGTLREAEIELAQGQTTADVIRKLGITEQIYYIPAPERQRAMLRLRGATVEHYYTPWELERAVARFVEHYNHRRVHESLCNVTLADMYAGRQQAILSRRERIKREALERRKRENLGRAA